MRIGFLGFGLIGGSVARAVRDRQADAPWTMTAWTPSGTGPRQAAVDGVLDAAAASPSDAIDGADLIVLAASATACLTLLDSIAGEWRTVLSADAVITDVASTKGALVARADEHGLRFVGGHPMAGTDAAGYEASVAGLFVDRPWVMVPGNHADAAAVARVTELATRCGARPMTMSAGEHDDAVAGISHLPLVVAAALVEGVAGPPGASRPDWPTARALAAGGWRDTTRLARGDPQMGAAIVVTNATALAGRLRDLQTVLDAWLAELERPDGQDEGAFRERLQAARDRLDRS
jgi:prephenate dehydrogenase